MEELGCLTTKFRGSGFKTALAASVLAHIYRDQDAAVALVVAANELDSDTDTIATMAGALLGAISDQPPEWRVQDREYIVGEALRLAAIARGEPQESFVYPDVGHWNPPTKQTASIGWCDGKLAIAGLGFLEPLSEEYRSGDAIWQWLALPFGQTILAKRKADLKDRMSMSQLPGPRMQARSMVASPSQQTEQSSLPFEGSGRSKDNAVRHPQAPSEPSATLAQDGIDAWTDAVIRSNFNDTDLGRLLNRCIDLTGSVDAAVAFSAIIAKAKLARKKRR
jgi:hypothetical protein